MNIKTRLAIFVVATILSLVGFSLIANALSVNRIMTAATPSTHFGVTVTS